MTKILIKDIVPFKDHQFRIEEDDAMNVRKILLMKI